MRSDDRIEPSSLGPAVERVGSPSALTLPCQIGNVAGLQSSYAQLLSQLWHETERWRNHPPRLRPSAGRSQPRRLPFPPLRRALPAAESRRPDHDPGRHHASDFSYQGFQPRPSEGIPPPRRPAPPRSAGKSSPFSPAAPAPIRPRPPLTGSVMPPGSSAPTSRSTKCPRRSAPSSIRLAGSGPDR